LKRILIIGDSNSLYIKRYIEHILLGGFEIYLVNYNDKANFSEFYAKNSIQLISAKGIPKLRDFKFGMLTRLLSVVTKRQKYDIIHVHYIGVFHMLVLCVAVLNWKTSHIVGTYWGSDLFRACDKKRKLLGRFLKHFRHISLSTNEMREEFTSIFDNTYDEKLRMALFGISRFADISAIMEAHTIDDCKAHISIDPKKTVVCVGYNAAEQQQHLKVIAQIPKLKKDILDRIVWVFPMTYGYSADETVIKVQEKLSSMDTDSIVIAEFMNDEEVAKLRIATDIFIHAQTTDAFSASIQESLYTGSIVVNPIWIQYSEIKKLGIKVLEYSEFDELPGILERLVQNGISRFEGNRKKLVSRTSWRAVKSDWLELY